MEPVRNDTTTDRRTAVELAKRLLVDSIWRTAKIEVDGVTFPDTQEIFDGRAPEGMSVDDIVTVNNIKRAWRLACISRFTLCAIWFTLTPGDVTHPKLAQLDELHIHLVMPKVVKESYDDLIQGETMTFSRFIEEIQGLQADRPQSLTLL